MIHSRKVDDGRVSHGERAGVHGTLYVDLRDLLSPYKSIGLDPMSALGRKQPFRTVGRLVYGILSGCFV